MADETRSSANEAPEPRARVVAVVGASADRRKYGNAAVRAFAAAGDTVVPINPREAMVEGLLAYPSVRAVAEPIDMATVYVPPDVALQLLPELRDKGIPEVWLNPGADRDDVIDEARRLGLRVVVACSIVALGQRPDVER